MFDCTRHNLRHRQTHTLPASSGSLRALQYETAQRGAFGSSGSSHMALAGRPAAQVTVNRVRSAGQSAASSVEGFGGHRGFAVVINHRAAASRPLPVTNALFSKRVAGQFVRR